MKRKLLFLIVAIVLIVAIALVAFFSPKNVGGPLCGPVCPPHGLHYFEQNCLGIKMRTTAIDAYSDTCYGVPIGEKRCYGVLYIENKNFEDREIDCNYPCNNGNIKSICQSQKDINFDSITYYCDRINRKCGW